MHFIILEDGCVSTFDVFLVCVCVCECECKRIPAMVHEPLGFGGPSPSHFVYHGTSLLIISHSMSMSFWTFSYLLPVSGRHFGNTGTWPSALSFFCFFVLFCETGFPVLELAL